MGRCAILSGECDRPAASPSRFCLDHLGLEFSDRLAENLRAALTRTCAGDCEGMERLNKRHRAAIEPDKRHGFMLWMAGSGMRVKFCPQCGGRLTTGDGRE